MEKNHVARRSALFLLASLSPPSRDLFSPDSQLEALFRIGSLREAIVRPTELGKLINIIDSSR